MTKQQKKAVLGLVPTPEQVKSWRTILEALNGLGKWGCLDIPDWDEYDRLVVLFGGLERAADPILVRALPVWIKEAGGAE